MNPIPFSLLPTDLAQQSRGVEDGGVAATQPTGRRAVASAWRYLPMEVFGVRPTEQACLSSLLDERFEDDAMTLARRLCGLCAEVTGVTGAALVVVSKVNRSTVCASDALSAELEDLAFACSEGPSVDASRRVRPVLVADLAAERPSRWPWFGPAAVQAGARAMFAFPLHFSGCPVGVLVLYRARPGGLTPDQVRDGWAMAEAACVLLSIEESDVAGGMRSDWAVGDRSSFRARVHQAVGLTMDDLNLDAVDALALIAAHAFGAGESIGAVAEAILTRKLRLEPA
jgi:hypothetical protein